MSVFASGLPIGPVGTMSHSQAVAFLVVSMACTVVVVGYAVYELVRRRSALLIYCLIGSVFCNFTEPFWDVRHRHLGVAVPRSMDRGFVGSCGSSQACGRLKPDRRTRYCQPAFS